MSGICLSDKGATLPPISLAESIGRPQKTLADYPRPAIRFSPKNFCKYADTFCSQALLGCIRHRGRARWSGSENSGHELGENENEAASVAASL